MKNVKLLTKSDLKTLFNTFPPKPGQKPDGKGGWIEATGTSHLEPFLNKGGEWNEDLDGSYLEQFVDANIGNYVRVGIVYEANVPSVILVEKDAFDAAIKNVDREALIARIAERRLNNNDMDYLEWYHDLLSPVIEEATGAVIDILYVNAYDYILNECRSITDKETDAMMDSLS